MMKNYDESVEINDNLNWPNVPDHLYRILIIGDSGSGKTNVLLNQILIKFMYVKDLKYELYVKVQLTC